MATYTMRCSGSSRSKVCISVSEGEMWAKMTKSSGTLTEWKANEIWEMWFMLFHLSARHIVVINVWQTKIILSHRITGDLDMTPHLTTLLQTAHGGAPNRNPFRVLLVGTCVPCALVSSLINHPFKGIAQCVWQIPFCHSPHVGTFHVSARCYKIGVGWLKKNQDMMFEDAKGLGTLHGSCLYPGPTLCLTACLHTWRLKHCAVETTGQTLQRFCILYSSDD